MTGHITYFAPRVYNWITSCTYFLNRILVHNSFNTEDGKTCFPKRTNEATKMECYNTTDWNLDNPQQKTWELLISPDEFVRNECSSSGRSVWRLCMQIIFHRFRFSLKGRIEIVFRWTESYLQVYILVRGICQKLSANWWSLEPLLQTKGWIKWQIRS